MELLVKNGIIYDPVNNIEGEVMDIAVRDGKIVESIDESKAKVIDASGKLVMAAGVDLHSHIAGPKVNAARVMRVEDHYKDFEVKTAYKHSGVGYSVPSMPTTGYRYAVMGYGTVCEAANPPLKMLHVHDELNDMPILDKAAYILLGNNWFVMEYLKQDKVEECAAYVSWIINRMKGYAIKIVDPGCVEGWKWGLGHELDLDDQIPYFGVNGRDIVRGLCKVNKMLKNPHPVHIHTNLLGVPGNYRTTLRTMDAVRDLAEDDKPILHVTHTQFLGYGGENWASLSSAADKIAKYVNMNKHISLDLGQIIFTDTTTMTADAPFEYMLQELMGERWMNTDTEAEEGSGVVPIHYRRRNYAHAVMWTIGLELALLVKDPWRVYLTTDHPNGGPFTSYPKVISWLMSRKAREKVLKTLPKMARRRSSLEDVDREYDFREVAITTRAGTAWILGLKSKGHLGVDADADIAVYDINPREVDPSQDYKAVRRAFAAAAYTIKDGRIVVKDGEVVDAPVGRTFWVKSEVSKDLASSVLSDVSEKFRRYYTVEMDNYGVPESYLARSECIKAGA